MLALSLKWRPQTFAQIEGQESIQKTLINAIKSNSIHPALIFSGPKGTGKTSTARILAKALCCRQRKNGEPCNQCSSCLSIQNGNDIDVMEIDGASNNNVDTIRDLRVSVQYMPSQGHLRIYIIDEVHMLSQSAFNALLKTLEEPPSHVHFILATTELRKIPATVSSRCQIFHFRPISNNIIQKRLKEICKAENIQIENEALWIITEQAQNSMRDAQILLDQMACLENKKITSENTIQVLGLTRRSVLNSILKSLIHKDTKHILSLINSLSFVDAQTFLNRLLIQIRNLLIIKLTKDAPSSFVFLMESEKEFLNKLAKNVSSENLHFLFDMCLKGCEDLRKSFDPHITLEMVLLRMSQAPFIEPLLARNNFDLKKSSDTSTVPASKKSDQKLQTKNVSLFFDQHQLENFVQFIQKKDPKTASHIKSYSFYQKNPNEIILGYPQSNIFLKEKSKNLEFQKKLEQYLYDFFGKKIKYCFVTNKMNSLRTKQLNEEYQYKINTIKSHPLARKITDIFQAQVQLPENSHQQSEV